MFEMSIFGDETSRTAAPEYVCSVCPPPWEPCPDDQGPGYPTDSSY